MTVNIFFQAHHSENFRFKKFEMDYTKWISSKYEILQVTSPTFTDHLSSFFVHPLTVILLKLLPFDWNAAQIILIPTK